MAIGVTAHGALLIGPEAICTTGLSSFSDESPAYYFEGNQLLTTSIASHVPAEYVEINSTFPRSPVQ
jgi:hypothetical protein